MIKLKRLALDFLGSKTFYLYIAIAVAVFFISFALLQTVNPEKYSIKTSFAITDASSSSKSVTEKLSMSEHYVWLFNEILNFDTIYENTAAELGSDITKDELKSMINTSTVDGTAIIDIYTTASTPELASSITRAFADNAVEYTKDSMPIDKVNILVLINPNEAVVENNNLIISLVISLLFFLLLFAVRSLFLLARNNVESSRDLKINYDVMLLGITPDGEICGNK